MEAGFRFGISVSDDEYIYCFSNLNFNQNEGIQNDRNVPYGNVPVCELVVLL